MGTRVAECVGRDIAVLPHQMDYRCREIAHATTTWNWREVGIPMASEDAAHLCEIVLEEMRQERGWRGVAIVHVFSNDLFRL